MNLADYKNIVIVGLGKTGTSCVKFLSDLGIAFKVNDSRLNPPGLPEVQHLLTSDNLELGQFDLDLLLEADLIILSQGIPLQDPVIEKVYHSGVKIISDVDLFAVYAKAPIIAITGSNAKSTVTSLVAHIFRQAGVHIEVGGNIGIPLLELLSKPIPQYYIVELSNFQLELTHELHTAIACILNLSPDHLDRYASYQDYVATKQRIYQGCENAIYFLDDKLTYPPKELPAVYFTDNEPSQNNFGLKTIGGDIWLSHGDTPYIKTQELTVKGKHGWLNALAATAISYQAGISLLHIKAGLQTFSGLAHRCQLIATHRQVDWINDSKGTNVGATLAALRGLGPSCKGKIVLILGGKGKGADFTVLADAIKSYCKLILIYGEDAKIIQSTVSMYPHKMVNNVGDVIMAAKAVVSPGDIVLFSPACASFDMFESFEHRGQVFTDSVKEMMANDK